MRVTQCNVFLLSILRNYSKLQTNPIKIIEFIEKFTFQYSLVSKLPGNAIEKIYSKYAIMIEEATRITNDSEVSKEIQKIFSAIKTELTERLPSQEMFLESFAQISYINSQPRRMLIKYILGKINRHLQSTQELEINYSDINIEHVLPQKPNEDWGLSKNDIKGYVHLLGNLTLIDKRINSTAQNYPIKEKINYFNKSTLEVTKNLVRFIEDNDFSWSEEVIEARQRYLGELALNQVWHIPH